VDGDCISESLDTLLQDKTLEAQYLLPGYLRTPLQQFIADQDHGVFWLRVPAHLGKTIFVEGLLPERRREENPRWSGGFSRSMVGALQFVCGVMPTADRLKPPLQRTLTFASTHLDLHFSVS